MTWLPEIDHVQHSCVERVGLALAEHPNLRGRIGLLLERARTDDNRIIWAAVCAHHCWLTDARDRVVETSSGNFAEPVDGLQLVGEPRDRRWIQLRPVQQDAVLRLAGMNQLRTEAELLYCPGQIAPDQAPPRYGMVWSQLAEQCQAAGGWDSEQWQRMQDALPALLQLT